VFDLLPLRRDWAQEYSRRKARPGKTSREPLRKQFSCTKHRDLNHFGEHVGNLLAHPPVSGVVDLQLLFFSLTLDITTALLLGRSVYSLRAAIDQDVENTLFTESSKNRSGRSGETLPHRPVAFLVQPL
jgi:hypothetical protein